MSNKESNGVLSCPFDNVNQFRDMSEMANYLVISKYEKRYCSNPKLQKK